MRAGKGRKDSLALFSPTINACACADVHRNQEAFAKRTSAAGGGRALPISPSRLFARWEKIARFLILRDTAVQCIKITRAHAIRAFIVNFPYYFSEASELAA